MKCLVLAGGMGERLWPLSRKNFPKQFIKIQKNHSIFQETIARNIPYCDEFIIVTNYEHRAIIANQMEAFQGVPYHCVYEEEPRKTTAAIVLSCLDLQPSEYVFVVAADHLISTSECSGLSYKDSILRAKEYAEKGCLTVFGKKTDQVIDRFGYFTETAFFEKPDRITIKQLRTQKICQNLGMLLFQNGTMLNEMNKLQEVILDQCKESHKQSIMLPDGKLYTSNTLQLITPLSIEKAIVERTDKLKCLEIGYDWNDVGNLEDLGKTEFEADGIGVLNECENTVILNQSPNQVVVVNDLDNVMVVNTTDAVYVGRRGKSHYLKQILHDNPVLESYSERGTIIYRPWGCYETIVEENTYRVRRVTILPGKTIYEHKHDERKENWTVIQGLGIITLSGKSSTYIAGDNIDIVAGTPHQISNAGENPLILIETAFGEVLHGEDIHSDSIVKITETDLGLQIDPMIKLLPVFRDYLWGGTKLRDLFGKQCDYEIIAESWELSAHPSGNSIIASGRHKGLSFSQYLEKVGRSVLGWKCMQAFPLLIKFIDAKDNLSVQVHPDDDYALENENEYGKNEMWYVIDSEPGAGLYIGFSKDVERKEVEKRVKNGTILEILNFYETHPGDVFFIPAGTVHAIGTGNLICEIQQSSNCTYRLYDYDRRDKFGNTRELHLKKALDVLNYKKYVPIELNHEGGSIRCKYFEIQIKDISGEEGFSLSDDSFHAIVCTKGRGSIWIEDRKQTIEAGETIFIPATNETMSMIGELSIILVRI